MLASNQRTAPKISREVSNFIITEVLENSDDLIKNSYRRLTTENVTRNEHWSRIAEKVAERFDVPAEMDRVKSHFHNRKKVLLARVKDELKLIQNSSTWTTDEKVAELARRRVCIGQYDEQLAKVCLDYEEEEKGRTDHYGNETRPPMVNLFTETSHQSLLTQLLNGPPSQTIGEKKFIPSPKGSQSSRESDIMMTIPPPPQHTTVAATRAPLLSRLLTEPSTSKENGHLRSEAPRMMRQPTEMRGPAIVFPDRKRPAENPIDMRNRSPVISNPNGKCMSHLIVDVSSSEELKRLLSVLIDNGFSRFHSVTNADMAASSIGADIHRAANLRHPDHTLHDTSNEDLFDREDTNHWAPRQSIPTQGNAFTSETDMLRSIANRVERVDVEVKTEPITDYDEEEDEYEVDEQTAELEAQLTSEAVQNGLGNFGKAPSPKRIKINGSSTSSSVNGDTVTSHCELCGAVIRLNARGSKWNFFEHVMMRHSVHKPFKCPICPFQAGRKARVKHHAAIQHHMECEPIDMLTPEIRKEWLKLMVMCFPDHQYTKYPKIE